LEDPDDGPGVITALHERSSSTRFVVYPNPTDGQVSIQPPSADAGRVEVRDITGRLVKSGSVRAQQPMLQLDITDCGPGVYFFSWAGEDGTAATVRAVLQ